MQSSDPIHSIRSQILAWMKAMPFFTRLILILTSLLSLLALFLPVLSTSLPLTSISFIENHAMYELFTFSYQHLSVLHLFFALLAFLPTACKTERSLGTYRYASFFIVTNVLLGLIYIVVISLGASAHLSLFMEAYRFYPCAGLWPILMTEMVIRCNKNPQARVKFMCFPVQIKNKYFPWIFFCVFSAMFRVGFDVLAGIIGGYLRKVYVDLLKFMKLTYITQPQAKILEGYCGAGVHGFILTLSSVEEGDRIAWPLENSLALPGPVALSETANVLGGETDSEMRNYEKFHDDNKL